MSQQPKTDTDVEHSNNTSNWHWFLTFPSIPIIPKIHDPDDKTKLRVNSTPVHNGLLSKL